MFFFVACFHRNHCIYIQYIIQTMYILFFHYTSWFVTHVQIRGMEQNAKCLHISVLSQKASAHCVCLQLISFWCTCKNSLIWRGDLSKIPIYMCIVQIRIIIIYIFGGDLSSHAHHIYVYNHIHNALCLKNALNWSNVLSVHFFVINCCYCCVLVTTAL